MLISCMRVAYTEKQHKIVHVQFEARKRKVVMLLNVVLSHNYEYTKVLGQSTEQAILRLENVYLGGDRCLGRKQKPGSIRQYFKTYIFFSGLIIVLNKIVYM